MLIDATFKAELKTQGLFMLRLKQSRFRSVSLESDLQMMDRPSFWNPVRVLSARIIHIDSTYKNVT